MHFQNPYGRVFLCYVNQHFGHVEVSIAPHTGYEPNFLIRPFSEQRISRISFIEASPAIGNQLQVIQELLIMLSGFGKPYKLRHPTKGIHQGMYFKTAFLSGAIQPLAAYASQYLAEKLNAAAVNNPQISPEDHRTYLMYVFIFCTGIPVLCIL